MKVGKLCYVMLHIKRTPQLGSSKNLETGTYIDKVLVKVVLNVVSDGHFKLHLYTS